MSLLQGTGALIVWIGQVLRAFLALNAGRTVAAILASMLQKISMILAFLLPLKVILLAGSPGIPRYFAFFIDPAHRDEWIFGLAAGSIIFYALNLFLQRRVSRLAHSMSEELFSAGGTYHRRSDQKEHFATQFERTASATGGVVFCLVSITVLTLLDSQLAIIIISLLTLEYIATGAALTLKFKKMAFLGGIIKEKTSSYLSFLSSINFLIGFFLILTPFLHGEERNILIALISFLMLRQTLSALARSINGYMRIYEERDSMRYLSPAKARKIASTEDRAETSMRESLSPEARKRQVLAFLQEVDPRVVEAQIDWQDPNTRGHFQFRVSGKSADGEVLFQGALSVFTHRARHEPQNESLLRQSTQDAFPGLPPYLGTVQMDEFVGVLHRFDTDTRIAAARWQEQNIQLLSAAWATPPPEEIISAYFKTHAPFESQLDDRLVQKLKVGSNGPEDEIAIAAFEERLTSIRATIARVPLYIHHSFRKSAAGALDEAGNGLFRRPGAWEVRPIGFYIPRQFKKAQLDSAIEDIRRARASEAAGLTEREVRLVELCAAIIQATAKQRLRLAIGHLPRATSMASPSDE